MALHLSQSKSCKSLQKLMNLCAMSTPQDAASPISFCPPTALASSPFSEPRKEGAFQEVDLCHSLCLCAFPHRDARLALPPPSDLWIPGSSLRAVFLDGPDENSSTFLVPVFCPILWRLFPKHYCNFTFIFLFICFLRLPVLCPVGISHAWCMTDTWYVEELSMPPGTV